MINFITRLLTAVVLCLCSSRSYASDEIIQFTELNTINEINDVFIAHKYLQSGDTVHAGKIFRRIYENPNTNIALKSYARSNFQRILNSYEPYKVGIRISPQVSERKYKSDVLKIKINNNDFDFVVDRSATIREVASLNQSYSFWLWPYLEAKWPDEIIASHRLMKFSNHTTGNEIGFSVKRTNESFNRTDTLNLTTKIINKSSENSEQKIELATEYSYKMNRIVGSLAHNLYKGQNYVFDYANTARVQYHKLFGDFQITLGTTKYDFQSSDLNHQIISIGGSRFIGKIGSKIRVVLENRYDEKIRFPADILRNDRKLSVEIDREFSLGDWSPQLILSATRNWSNIAIYSYDEASLHLNFDLN